MDWLRSTRGVLFLSYLGILSVLVRSYMDTRYILVEDFSKFGEGFVILWIIAYSLFVGVWIWSLVSAGRESKRAVYVLLAYALICFLVLGLASLFLYADHVEEFLIFGANLITGGLATGSIILHLRSRGA